MAQQRVVCFFEQNFKYLLGTGVAVWGVYEAKEGGLFKMDLSVKQPSSGGELSGSISMSALQDTISTTMRKEMKSLSDAQDEYVDVITFLLILQNQSYSSQASGRCQ